MPDNEDRAPAAGAGVASSSPSTVRLVDELQTFGADQTAGWSTKSSTAGGVRSAAQRPPFRRLTRYNNRRTRPVRAGAPRANGMIAAVTITIHAIELVIVCVIVLLWLLVVTWRRI